MSSNSKIPDISAGVFKNMSTDKIIMYSSLLVLVIVGVASLVMGILIMNQAKKQPERSSKKMTTAGSLAISFGCIDLILTGYFIYRTFFTSS